MASLIRHATGIPSRMAAFAETSLLHALGMQPRFPPLFVVGAPRCGTTLPYLYLVDRFGFAYFPNHAKRYPAMPVAAGWMARRGNQRRKFGLESQYGAVDGRLAPSDGWDVFHRWFPRYRMEPVRRGQLGELRRIVGAYERMWGKPFISKNNHNSIRIAELDKTFPNAFFIHVTRNVVDASLSLLEARKRHGVPLGDWWSCPAPQYMDRRFASEIEQVVHTIVGIRQYVRQQLGLLDKHRWIEIAYEDFCMAPAELASWVESHYPECTPNDGLPGYGPVLGARSHSGRSSPDLVAAINAVLDDL
jgi:hypothetical protein